MPLPRFYSARRFHRARLRDLRRAQRRALRDFAVLSDFAELVDPIERPIRLPNGHILPLREWVRIPVFVEIERAYRLWSGTP